MSKLRFEQRKGEPADIFAMRVFASVLPSLSVNSARAAAKWIYAIAEAFAQAREADK